jgi:hypothetical protein
MTFPIEIVLRERDQAVTTQIVVPSDPRAGERTPGEWTDADVEDALKQMLLAIDRVKNPAADQRYVALRGFSWIVEPSGDGGVVIAIEIPSGAAVAGPFAVEQTVLDGRIARLVAAARVPRPVVH